MSNTEKTKEQLIHEVAELRRQNESLQLYKEIVGHLPIGLVVCVQEDPADLGSFRFILRNSMAASITHVPEEEFIDKTVRESFPEFLETEGPGAYAKAIRTGQTQKLPNLRYGDKNVPEGIFSVTIVPLGANYLSVFFEDITASEKAQEQLHLYQDQLRSLASQLILTGEQERRQIASDLHDRIGQALVLAKIKLGVLGNSLTSSELTTSVEEIRALLDQTLEDTRTLTFELSPPVLHELGLEAALDWLADQMQEQHNLRIEVETFEQSNSLDDEMRALLFRGVRELLVNVVNHAQTGYAKVVLKKNGGNIQVEVEDDGVGFDSSQLNDYRKGSRGFGLFDLRERLDLLGGSLQITSKPGEGTRVVIVAPLSSKRK